MLIIRANSDYDILSKRKKKLGTKIKPDESDFPTNGNEKQCELMCVRDSDKSKVVKIKRRF
jgi:hypothetical protein